jgi:hypothetical protein
MNIHDPDQLPIDRYARLVYAIVIEGLDKEQRAKIDAALDTDTDDRTDRRAALVAAGFTPEAAERTMRLNSISDPDERMAEKVRQVREKAARRRAAKEAAEVTGG